MHLCEPISPYPHFHVGLLWRLLLLLALMLAVPFLAGCRHSQPAIAAADTFTLESASLRNGQVPKQYTCDGDDTSPPLQWTAPPVGTRSLALTMTDPDAPGGTFTHWVLFNLPAAGRSLPEGVPKQGQLPDGSSQGTNDFGKLGYGGPCPPAGKPHRYIFTLNAIDRELDIASGATRPQLENAINGHALAHSELTARYGR
jgi:Raf kinase inhibitor-like YbhB/YbcL family protein